MDDRTSRFALVLLSLALALLSTATLAFADRASLQVMVRGGVDGDAIRSKLASELKLRVELAEDSCEAPCVLVTIDGNEATVQFTPARGSPRARTVELGTDPAQWPVMITLLAGNVVRDEAADVLALLPEPPKPETPLAPVDAMELDATVPQPPSETPVTGPALVPPLVAVERERRWKLLGFGFVPGLSTDFTQIGRVQHFLSLDIIAGVSAGSTGVTLSGVADIERGRVWGFQLAGVTTVAQRVDGAQVAGVAAVAGDFNGVQIAGTAAIADRVDGAQVAGVATVAGKADMQIAGVATVAKGRASTQIAGVAAVADGAARIQFAGVAVAARGDTNIQAAGVASVAHAANVQVAGVASVAHGTANIQIAGLVNVAQRLEGVQIAPINVARRVDGVQVGVINIGSADGFSFGLINIVPGGRADIEATVDSSRLGTVLFRHGGRRWHNVYGVGGHPVTEEQGPSDDVWMYGLGFGPSWRAGSTVFDLELIGWQINHGARHSEDLSVLGQLRLSVAYGFGSFKLVAGGALNAYFSTDQQSPLILERRIPEAMDEKKITVDFWPSAFIGLRI